MTVAGTARRERQIQELLFYSCSVGISSSFQPLTIWCFLTLYCDCLKRTAKCNFVSSNVSHRQYLRKAEQMRNVFSLHCLDANNDATQNA